jgi:predicted RNA-binding protein with PIN domain
MDEPLGDAGRRTVVVDGNNVIGAVADGWWRDRPAAVRRLVGRLRCHLARTGDRVVLVLDVPQPDLPGGDNDGIEVVYPRRRGRDAADERILQLLDEMARTDGPGQPPGAVEPVGQGEPVEVVTSDRALAAGATRRRARVVGAGTFLARLDRAGC